MSGAGFDIRAQKRFDGFELDVAFETPRGVTALVGRSGAGKTTIVNAVAGLLRLDAGRVTVGGAALYDASSGVDLPAARRRLGCVFQDGRLFPHLTVRDNLAFGGRFSPAPFTPDQFDQAIALLGLEALLARRPATLSGGERQRVALGRALLSSPRALVMDEPLAALDPERKAEIIPYLERLCSEADLPILYVSHAADEVARLADAIVRIEAGRVASIEPASPAGLGDGPRAAHPIAGRIVGRADDGLAEVATALGTIWAVGEGEVGAAVSLRLGPVELATDAAGRSAVNALSAQLLDLAPASPWEFSATVTLGADVIEARIARRVAERLGLAPGATCLALLGPAAIASPARSAAPSRS